MAMTWILDVALTDGTRYRILGAQPVRNDTDLDELKDDLLRMLSTPALMLRPAGFAGSANTVFVAFPVSSIVKVELREHDGAPDPLAMLWTVDPRTDAAALG
jgi:hypothetical protein